MKTDEIIDWVEILEQENKELKAKNIDLILQTRRLRESLESALNILEPEQVRIISNDLTDINYLNINQHA
jgi:hypothetical protein